MAVVSHHVAAQCGRFLKRLRAIGRSRSVPTPASRVVRELRHFGKLIGRTLLFVYVPLITGLVLLHYPYDTDASQRASKETAPSESTATFYEVAYSKTDKRKRGVDYEATAAEAAVASDIKGQVSRFVAKHQLQNKRILDVGSGRGYLQDIVADYTGLDLSPTVRRSTTSPLSSDQRRRCRFLTIISTQLGQCGSWNTSPNPRRRLPRCGASSSRADICS